MKCFLHKISLIIFIISLAAITACQNDKAGVDAPAGDYDIPDIEDREAADGHKDVAIYYDPPASGRADGDYTHGMMKAVMLRNLLGHFNTDVQIFPVDEYKSGDIDNYDALMYIGSVENQTMRHAFLSDVYETKKPVYWIGLNFHRLAQNRAYDTGERWKIIYKGNTQIEGAGTIEYEGKSLPREAGDPYFAEAYPGDNSYCDTKAIIKGASQKLPLLIECGNLFYMTDDPFTYQQGTYLVLADSLHDFLDTIQPEDHRAVLRIQGVSPGVDSNDQLKDLAARLEKLNVPFMLSVVPRYIDQEGINYSKGSEKSLAASEHLVSTMKSLQKKGATVIANGFTHQNKNTSYLDYEFWSMETNRAVPEDTWEWAHERLVSSLSEFRSAGFEVNLWQTPSYFASYTDYFVFASKIAAVNERMLVFDVVEKPADGEYLYTGDWYFSNQSVPYMIYRSHYGFAVIPENLGGIAKDQTGERGLPLNADTIEQFATEHAAVRDATVGFYFNVWDSADDLIDAVKRVQNLGYRFVSATELLESQPPEYEEEISDGDADGDGDDGESGPVSCVYGADECPRPTGCHNGFCGRCEDAFECREYETCRADGSCGECSDDTACRPGSVCRYGFCMPSRIETYNMVIDPQDFATMVEDVENQNYYPCELQYEGIDYSTGQTECRLQGYSSRKKYPKKSFRIKFPEDSEHPGYSRKIILKADYNDPTFMRSVLSFETSRRLTDVPTPRIRYRRLDVNGEYYGLFMEIERISGDFMEDRGRDASQSIYDADFTPPYGGLVPLESADLYPRYYQKRDYVEDEPLTDLIELIEDVLWEDYKLTADNGVTSLARTQDYVHLNEYVDYLAAMALIQNIDTIENNYTFSWQQLNGRYAWEFYPWDMDISFGCQWQGANRNAICRGLTSEMWWLSGIALDGVTIGAGYDVWCNMLIHLTLNHPWTRKRYEDRLCEFAHSSWWNEQLPRFVKALHDTIKDEVADDPNDLCATQDEWQADIELLLQFVKDRKEYLQDEILCYDEDYR